MDSHSNAVRCGKSKYKGGTSTRKRTNSKAGLTATQARSMFAITSPATLVSAPTACFKVRDPFLSTISRGRANPDPPDRRARQKDLIPPSRLS